MPTIWSPANQRAVLPNDRLLVLYVYPLVYLVNAVTYLTVGTANGGSKVMRAALGEWGSAGTSFLIGSSSLIGLIGLVLMKHQLERVGAIVMVSGVVLYLVLLFFALGAGGSPVSSLAGTAIVVVLMGARVQQVSKDIGRRRARRVRA